MIRVSYSSPFVPVEWLRAHGVEPIRFDRDQPPATAMEGCCAFAMEFLAEARQEEYDCVVAATTCDQMRHVPELLDNGTPAFLLNVPSTWQTVGAFKLYRDELCRLGAFLCRHGGITPDDATLINAMVKEETRRLSEGADGNPAIQGRDYDHKIYVGITGGPLLTGANSLIEIVEQAGGIVVLDATESGELTVPSKFDRRRLREEPFQVLAETYFAIPDIGQRPNSRYYEFLDRELPKREVKGLIIQRYTWCDLWHAEVKRIKDWAPVPVLDLGGDHACDARTTTRIQAFMEMLRD